MTTEYESQQKDSSPLPTVHTHYRLPVKEGNDDIKMGVVHNYGWTTNQILFPAILLLAIGVYACVRESKLHIEGRGREEVKIGQLK